jgi:hypothetical protein
VLPGESRRGLTWYGPLDMVAHMKTTVEISEALLRQAKQLAAAQGTTLRQLIEAGLRHVLKTRRAGREFQLRDASFGGRGLRPEFSEGGRSAIQAAYEGRGEPS